MDIVNASHSLVRSYFVTDLILISISTYLSVMYVTQWKPVYQVGEIKIGKPINQPNKSNWVNVWAITHVDFVDTQTDNTGLRNLFYKD